ncbi:MAG TPA: LytTR family DNA-binding domain-containing protein [Gemmatimonadaceae bacterium]|nr:LytTR family DNA-binding domain-containing protein [Gemmatimonadaceae bacterium]
MIESTRVLMLAEDDEQIETPDARLAPDVHDVVAPSRIDAIARTVVDLLRAERQRSRIVVRSERRLLFLRQDEIDWVEAAGNYVRLHVRGSAHVLRQSMKNMEARLDPQMFVRIHRSAIVNVEHIRELQPWLHGEYVVILDDGTRLSASRVFSDRLDALID